MSQPPDLLTLATCFWVALTFVALATALITGLQGGDAAWLLASYAAAGWIALALFPDGAAGAAWSIPPCVLGAGAGVIVSLWIRNTVEDFLHMRWQERERTVRDAELALVLAHARAAARAARPLDESIERYARGE